MIYKFLLCIVNQMACLTVERKAELQQEAADLELLIAALQAGLTASAASGIQSFSLDTGIAKQSTKNYNIAEAAQTLRQWRSELERINRILNGTAFPITTLKRFGY